MAPKPARILCVGNDANLLATRCAVLNRSGYDATCATVIEAETLLGSGKYDLVVVSAMLADSEKRRVLSAASHGSALVLRGLTMAPELLALVEARLAAGR